MPPSLLLDVDAKRNNSNAKNSYLSPPSGKTLTYSIWQKEQKMDYKNVYIYIPFCALSQTIFFKNTCLSISILLWYDSDNRCVTFYHLLLKINCLLLLFSFIQIGFILFIQFVLTSELQSYRYRRKDRSSINFFRRHATCPYLSYIISKVASILHILCVFI